MHGKNQGTHGWGARKQHRSSGNKGGTGMAGTGKRADHKKTLITKLYGNKYFGKQGITSKGTSKDKGDRINLNDIETNLETYLKKGIAKKTAEGFEVNLTTYKILGGSKNYSFKGKFIIKAESASKSATEKVKKEGGEIQVIKKINKSENQS